MIYLSDKRNLVGVVTCSPFKDLLSTKLLSHVVVDIAASVKN